MKSIFNLLLIINTCFGVLTTTSAYADFPFGEPELRELQAEFENPWCLKGCETEDWAIRAIDFPPNSQNLISSDDVLFFVSGKPPGLCGSQGCVEAYVLRDNNYLYVLANGYNTPKIRVEDIPSIRIRREIQREGTLISYFLNKIDVPPVLTKSDNLKINKNNLKLGLITVLKDELATGYGTNFDSETVCRNGMADALQKAQKSDLIKISLNQLAATIFGETIGLIPVGNPFTDFLLKFGIYLTKAAVLDKSIAEESAIFLMKKAVGYIISNSFDNALLNKTASSLSKSLIEKILDNENKLSVWKLSGNNKESMWVNAGENPNTEIEAEVFYNPINHYVTAIINSTCEGEVTENKAYILRYQVYKTSSKSAEAVDGTVEIIPIRKATVNEINDLTQMTQLALLPSLKRSKQLGTNRYEIYQHEVELDILNSSKQSQGQCPSQITVTEQNTIYEAGYSVNGYARFNSFANSFSIISDSPSRVTWSAALKNDYKTCIAESNISKTDGNIDNNTYMFIKFDKGRVDFTLDLMQLRDPNDETPEINSKDIIRDNPVWTWSGTD